VSQLHKAITPYRSVATSIRRLPLPRRTIVAGSVLMGSVLLAAYAATGMNPPASGSDTSTGVTDGWLHGTSALTSRRTAVSGEETDGWAPRYLRSPQRGGNTDGWASRYLVAAKQLPVTDGWASRYLPSPQGD
jgi:hypothetical protein